MGIERLHSILNLFLLYIFSMILLWIGIAYISQNIRYSSAQRYLSFAIAQMENNYFADNVVEQCIQEGREHGYTINVKKYEREGNTDAGVSLEYTYIFPVFQKKVTYTLEGYAR